ncbi:hypothetical protein ACFL0U_03135 [Pseudomonadota bacterium]
MQYRAITFDGKSQIVKGFEMGRCDALTSDLSQLASLKLKLKNPNSFIILPEVISKEPLGPSVRQGDDQWFNIVKWTLIAMKNAEELGIDSSNASELKENGSIAQKRLLGTIGNHGKDIGLENDWAYNIIIQVGNYGEIFDKNVGKNSILKIDRGINKLWKDGGIHYGPPII